MHDIVYPSGNEQEYIELAKKLGITTLTFIYKNKTDYYTKQADITIKNALLAEPKSVQKNTTTICLASREAIERSANITYGFELVEQKEHTHHRRSGLNQVLAKLATQKNVKIGLAFTHILNNTGQKRATILGRITQNIKICQKYKTPLKIASFATNPYEMRTPQDLTAFYTKLGMNPETIKKALE